MLRLFKAKEREPYDFSQILGSCTEAGRIAGASWGNVNIANASDVRAQELAAYFIHFHKELLAAPETTGLLEPSASYANFRALELARDATGKTKVLCSNLSHVSIERACHSLQLEPIILVAYPENKYQVDEQQVAKAIAKHGNDIAAIVSTYGTTQLGHVEILAESDGVRQLQSEGAWLHIDAAYGGYIGTLQKCQATETFATADSVTIDPYKFVGLPGVALLLIEKEKAPIPNIQYYTHSRYTLQTTLPTGPIAAWAKTVQDLGNIYGLREIADQCTAIARQAAAELQRKGIPLILFPQLSIVPIETDTRTKAEYLHRELLEAGFSVGKVHIKGEEYETNGIRIVITPKVNPELMYGTALQLVDQIAKVYNRV